MNRPSKQRAGKTRASVVVGTVLAASCAIGLGTATASSPPADDADCTPGTTGRIAFMLKQQTAFRYLNADIPFFEETAEAAGYEVIVQSAENDAVDPGLPGRERVDPGR